MSQSTGYEKAEIKALRLHDALWSLELERLQVAGNGIFHAISEEIEGTDEILRVLELLLGRADIAAQTRSLFAEESTDERRLYRLANERWLPMPVAAYVDPNKSPRRGASALASSLASLKALRSAALEHQHRATAAHASGADASHPSFAQLERRFEELARTVANLERRITALEQGAPRAASVSDPEAPAPPPEPPLKLTPERNPEPSAAPPAESAPAAADTPAPEASPASAAEEPGAAGASEAASAPPMEPAQPEEEPESAEPEKKCPLPSLPSLESLQETGEMLFGDEVTLDATDGKLPTKKAYLAELIDDQDQIVGVVLSEISAMVALGGAMLMIPKDAWKELLVAPSDDILDAMSEIVNNITPLLNTAPGNVHVRSMPLKEYDTSMHPWMADASRIMFKESEFDGVFAIVAAPEPLPPA